MSKYEITPLNSNKTILQVVKGIEKYLHDNQIYKVFGYNGNYDAETELYDISDLYTSEELKADDVVLFDNCYLGIVDAVGTNNFSVKDVINFRGEKGDTGATGEKGEKGDKGDTGETGATGQTGATGNGIASIAKTGTSGLVDTYTITFTDGSTFTYNVTNGKDGSVTATTLFDTYTEIQDKAEHTISVTKSASQGKLYLIGVNVSGNEMEYMFKKLGFNYAHLSCVGSNQTIFTLSFTSLNTTSWKVQLSYPIQINTAKQIIDYAGSIAITKISEISGV